MMQTMAEWRFVISMALAAIVGTVGLQVWPWPADQPLLRLIFWESPRVYAGLTYGYAALWMSTPYFTMLSVLSVLYIFGGGRGRARPRLRPLPAYPAPETRAELSLVLGERHYRTALRPAPEPYWLTIPERGLYTGVAIIGATGSGKTSAGLHPYLEQLLAFQADDPARKVGGLFLEVKGDFCPHVRDILRRYGREHDYIEVGLDSPFRYNPLHNDLDAYALAFGIATLVTNLFGRGKEPFWQQASTNLVKFVILLHQVLDDYVTLFQVYAHVINPDKLAAKIAEGGRRLASQGQRVSVRKDAYAVSAALSAWTWHDAETPGTLWADWAPALVEAAASAKIPIEIVPAPGPAFDNDRREQFEAVKRWFHDDWMRIEDKLRTSIVEGISVFLSLFDDNPKVKRTFCPSKDLYDPAKNPDGRLGTALPPIADLIEQGKIVALNFPGAMNPALARGLGTMLKLDFQRAVLARTHTMGPDRGATRRPVLFICDEYQAFATTGESEPTGDEKFFSLARQAKCIPIVGTQSLSSLRSVLPGESWRTLLQGLRTKVFLTLSDDFSAQVAADLCGKTERLKPSYTITEAGQDARVSLLTGRAVAHKSTVGTTKTYTLQREYVFDPTIFTELPNAVAIVLAYDGRRPQPATYCLLKPAHLDVQTGYFDHAARGAL
jgi:hypothetical protein